METELLTPDEAGLQKAAGLIREGQVVGMPTETVYGLAADATNRDAVAKVFAAKGRPMDNPLIVHISSMEELEQAVSRVPELVTSLADAFWPGPLTMIMPKSERIPMETSGGLDTVGVRMPSHPVAQALIRTAGVPIAAPSANRSGYPSPTTAQHVLADMQGRIPAILDGGACSCGLESTVVTFDDDRTVRILRPGFVTKEMLLEHVPNVVIDPAIFRQVSARDDFSIPVHPVHDQLDADIGRGRSGVYNLDAGLFAVFHVLIDLNFGCGSLKCVRHRRRVRFEISKRRADGQREDQAQGEDERGFSPA